MYIHIEKGKRNVQELKMVFIQYIQGLCQSRLSTADYALLLVAFATTAVFRHLNVRTLDRRQV
jgi:hypothetical protein